MIYASELPVNDNLGFYNNPEDASSCLEFYHKKGGYHHGEFDLDNAPAPILRGSVCLLKEDLARNEQKQQHWAALPAQAKVLIRPQTKGELSPSYAD